MSAFRDLFERLSDRSVERAAIAEWGVAIGARVVL